MSRSPRRLPGAYWRLYAGSAISNLGDGVLVAALPLLAARITDDRLSVGLVSTFFTIPWLLLALPVGALVDRADRRTVLVLADTYRAVLVGGLAAVAAFADVQTTATSLRCATRARIWACWWSPAATAMERSPRMISPSSVNCSIRS